MAMRPGMPADEAQIRDAQLRLGLLPNFATVEIRLEKGSARGLAVLVVKVKEADRFATAFVLGSAYRFGGFTQTAAASVSDSNLFGTGKTLSLDAIGAQSLSGRPARESLARLQYFDPQLFGSPRYVLFASAYYLNSDYAYGNGDSYDNRIFTATVGVGRRLTEHSVFSVFYHFSPSFSLSDHFRDGGDGFVTITGTPRNSFLVSYGFRSEDDPNFPTHGWFSQFSLGRSLTSQLAETGAKQRQEGFALGGESRATWSLSRESFLTMQLRLEPVIQARASFLDEPMALVSYSHTLALGNAESVERARWYVGAGLTNVGFDAQAYGLIEAGVRAGVRFETKSLGVVNLYVVVDTPTWRRGY
jgi:outer membrane protein assembly factor BamA